MAVGRVRVSKDVTAGQLLEASVTRALRSAGIEGRVTRMEVRAGETQALRSQQSGSVPIAYVTTGLPTLTIEVDLKSISLDGGAAGAARTLGNLLDRPARAIALAGEEV